MSLRTIQSLLDAEVLTTGLDPDDKIQTVMASDLMSDVLCFCCAGALLVTGLTNAQTIRTAEVAELCGVVYARGKRPSEETIQLASERSILLLATSLTVFDACGVLYSNGMKGIQHRKSSDGR